MTPNITLAAVAGILVACGVYLLTERSLSRILVGVIVMSNGVNLLFLVAAGHAGIPAFVGDGPESAMTDPLPQGMVLTAIVITMAISAFVITMAYRSFQLDGNDEVTDDVDWAAEAASTSAPWYGIRHGRDGVAQQLLDAGRRQRLSRLRPTGGTRLQRQLGARNGGHPRRQRHRQILPRLHHQ